MKKIATGPRNALRSCALALIIGLLAAPSAFAQTGSVSGRVIDGDDLLPLAGATIQIQNNSGAMVTGAATDVDGRYTITGLNAGGYTAVASFVGYSVQEVSIQVAAGQTATADFALSVGITLNMVVVTSGRQPEKVLDAPASISVLTAEDVAGDIGTSSIEALRTTTGVDMAQTGIDRREVVLRGFNNAFSGATYVLTDYRQAAAPSLGVNIFSIMPNINIDVDRVEVVRGPGSALYGPGVDSGVIHFITKGPFEHPGTTVSVSGGERSYMGIQFRHAGVASPKFGYKLTGTYGQADDWAMDPNNAEDAVQLAGDVTDRNNDFEKFNINANLEFRPRDGTSIIANFGTSALTSTVLSGIGTLQADGFGYRYGQVRLQSGNLFAQAYVNQNDAGKSFVYDQDFNGDGVPDPVTDNGVQINFQTQYDYQMSRNQSFILGADADLTRPDTEGTILGRNEDNDSINEYGVYLQSQTALTPKFDAVLALRGDYNDVQEAATLSPRAALVFKPDNNNSFRVTYNRAFSSPGTNSNFLDIVASTSPLIARGRGSAAGFNWERNSSYLGLGAITDLVATSLLPTSLGQPSPVGADLGEMYGLVYAGLAAMPTANIAAILNAQGIPIDVATTGQLVQLLSPQAGTQVSGFTPGIMAILNLTTGAPGALPDDLANIKPLEQTTTQTFEVGYKGFIANKLSFTVDAYYTQKENFVGPLLLETPLVLVPNLGNDLSVALAAGIQGNPTLAGALGSFGLSPAAVAGLVVALAEPDFPSAVGIVQPGENNPGPGTAPELMLTYRNFGKLSYAGVDVSFDYFHNNQLSFFGNVSWVSDDFFDSSELEEDNPDLALALNATTLKGRIGAKYRADSGLSANVAVRVTDGFPIRSGPYVGDLPAFTMVDIGMSYDLNANVPGLTVGVGVNNALNEEHREFIGAPLLGRMVIGRLTYSF
jgi:outer membrane receptor for ferrienterochelin and colicins